MSTSHRNVRIDDDLWQACKAYAYAERRTITDVMVRALETYRDEQFKIHNSVHNPPEASREGK